MPSIMSVPICSGVLFVLVAIFLGCARQPNERNSGPTTKEIASSYKDFQQITKSMVFVNPELAMACHGQTKEEIDRARAHFGPHANAAILIYMNDLAATAFKTKAGQYPVGAAIVKQKAVTAFPDEHGKSEPAENGVGGMVKRSPGFDPEHGDWEYFYFENPRRIESGRIGSCVQCHASAKNKDYVFGTWNKETP